MAQTITENYTNESIAYVTRLSGCTPTITEWFTTITLSHDVTVDNVRERRVKPLKRPLVLNAPTIQPKQYKLKSISAKSSSGWVNVGTYCNKPILKKFVYYRNPVETCLYDIGSERTNWSGRMREELKDLRLNLGPSLVEYRETRDMFVSAAVTIRDIYRKVRSGKFITKRRKKTPCRLAGAHLGMTYGVMPLVGDLFESVERLKSVLDDPLIKRISVYNSRQGRYSEESAGQKLDGYWKVSERATAYIRLIPNYGGFTLGNPAEWIWEAVTLSFVIDWMIPIGSWLSSLDALSGVEDLKGTVTRKEAWGHTGEILPWESLTYPIVADRRSQTDYESHERFVISDVPLPPFPSWEPTKSWRALVNGVALLVGMGDQCKKKGKSNPNDWATYG